MALPTFIQCWRWFGDSDTISLSQIKQTGATGIVTALHHIPNGDVWTLEEIEKRKLTIEEAGLQWRVVESVPVHEDIKKRSGDFERYVENYRQSVANLGAFGIKTVCYNFMPVLDWTRTDLNYQLPDGSRALRFSSTAFAAFDLFILKRETSDYSADEREAAAKYLDSASQEDIDNLTRTILAGLPGAEEGYTVEQFRQQLEEYDEIGPEELKSNLYRFLQSVIPAAENAGVQMAIHPDDPPFSLFGLPRVVSTASDLFELLTAADSEANGLTFCTGSLGVRADNNLVDMINRFGDRIHFVHLRATQRDDTGNFFEAPHLAGDVDMAGVMEALVREQSRRAEAGRVDLDMPFRPDHGHALLDDQHRRTNPGYSLLGRMKGLAELRGLELGIRSMLK